MALAKYIYVQCSRCAKAYFGGDARCQQQLEESGLSERAFDPNELVCGGCAVSSGLGMANGGGICGRHGTDFLEFKCRFCCSVAIYFWYFYKKIYKENVKLKLILKYFIMRNIFLQINLL
jgi:RCR-type E3 ubiquitin transferase